MSDLGVSTGGPAYYGSNDESFEEEQPELDYSYDDDNGDGDNDIDDENDGDHKGTISIPVRFERKTALDEGGTWKTRAGKTRSSMSSFEIEGGDRSVGTVAGGLYAISSDLNDTGGDFGQAQESIAVRVLQVVGLIVLAFTVRILVFIFIEKGSIYNMENSASIINRIISGHNSLHTSSLLDFKFTLRRKGYAEPLGYFNRVHSYRRPRKPSDILVYEFISRRPDNIIAVIEPSADMELVVFEDLTDGEVFKYDVCPWDHVGTDYEGCDHGELRNHQASSGSNEERDREATYTNLVNIPCRPPWRYAIYVTAFSINGATLGHVEGNASCSYVRREIRSLSNDDRQRTLQALHTLWNPTSSDPSISCTDHLMKGCSSIMDGLVSSIRGHNELSAFHGNVIGEGIGFLSQHIKMARFVEQQMQIIDPSVSLPYWDFTIDSALWGSNNTISHRVLKSVWSSSPTPDGDRAELASSNDSDATIDTESGDVGSIFDAYVFQPSILGSLLEPPTRDRDYWSSFSASLFDCCGIPNGLWQQTTVNPMLRDPWNLNPSSLISRFTSEMSNSLPTCQDHINWVSIEDDVELLRQAEYGPYSNVLSALSNVFSCDSLTPLLQHKLISSVEAQNTICLQWSSFLRHLYRLDLIAPASDSLHCDKSQLKTIITAFEDFFPVELRAGTTKARDWKIWIDLLCDEQGRKILSGDITDASVGLYDPAYWLAIPTLERLYHARLMASYASTRVTGSGYYSSASAATEDDDHNDDLFFKNPVLSWWPERGSSQAEDACDTAKYCNFTETACCMGHWPDDTVPQILSVDHDVTYISNADVLISVYPAHETYAVPYIYDGFKWDHCNVEVQEIVPESDKEPNSYSDDLQDGVQAALVSDLL
jgi:hypothetical protein